MHGVKNSRALWAIIFLVLLKCCLVSCDFSIHDKITNQLVFQTASDFVRTSECGSLFHKQQAHLVVSEPLYTCEESISTPPISTIEYFSSALKDKLALLADLLFGVDLTRQVQEDVPWVLVTGFEADGVCDLKIKLKIFADAGYSAVLLATNRNKTQFLNVLWNSLDNEQQNFLDLHLINPWDIRVLSKYAYPNSSSFVVSSPPNNKTATCTDFYSTTRLHVQKTLINDWFNEWWDGIVDYNWNWIYRYTNLKQGDMNKMWRKAKSVAYSIFIYGFFSFILLAPWVFLCYASWKEGRQQEEKERVRNQNQEYFHRAHFNQHAKDNFKETTPPPRPPPPPPRPSERKIVREHRLRLGMSPNEKLTAKNVNSAYKRMSVLQHPDKHPEKDRRRQDEIMKQVNASKAYLLKICYDAKHEE